MADKMHTLRGTKGYMFDAPARMLPSFSLSEKDLPEVKEWHVGKRYKLEIEVEQMSINKDEYMIGAPISARFKIHKIKSLSDDKETQKAKKGYA